jgi:glycosyltransferase involved in cell wall biosynthesis
MPAPRLVYVVTEDWYFVAHRLPMARAAKRAGYDVHVATRVARHGAAISAEGFHLHPVEWHRGSINPLAFAADVRAIRRLYRQLAPDLVHHVALQPSVVGSIAATGLSFARVNALVGLGFVFTSRSPKALLARALLKPVLPRLLGQKDSTVVVENPDDRAELGNLGIAVDRIVVIHGSGVDVDRFTSMPEPAGPITIGFAGRMLDDKGVRTLVAAHDLLRQRASPIRLLLAGAPDPGNSASIPVDEIRAWGERPGITWLGQIDDIRRLWADAHIAVLPSRREGLPISLIEAAACGRPIVATDVPGCREVAREGINALLVPPDDPAALAAAIERLAEDSERRQAFGTAGRKLAVDEFSSARVGRDVLALYDRLTGRGASGSR